MNELRRRVFLPLVVSLVVIGVTLFVVIDFSRVLLALSSRAATITAAAAALAILFGAARPPSRNRTEAGTGPLVLAVAGLVLVAGALVGVARVDEVRAEAARAKAEQAQAGSVTAPPDVTIVAFDIGFRDRHLTARAG